MKSFVLFRGLGVRRDETRPVRSIDRSSLGQVSRCSTTLTNDQARILLTPPLSIRSVDPLVPTAPFLTSPSRGDDKIAPETPGPAAEIVPETPTPTEGTEPAPESPAPVGEEAPTAEETPGPAPVAETTPAPAAPTTPSPAALTTPSPAAPTTPSPAAPTTPSPVAPPTTPAPVAPVEPPTTPAPFGKPRHEKLEIVGVMDGTAQKPYVRVSCVIWFLNWFSLWGRRRGAGGVLA